MNLLVRGRRQEQGYVLLVLLLFIALLSISFLGMVQRVDFQIRRDREEELIHRGVQYSRAVRKFVKQFGRYPETIEELERTNNIRTLRRRYKDPVTGKDFKLLHVNELQTFASIAPPSADADDSQQVLPDSRQGKLAAQIRPDQPETVDSQTFETNDQSNAVQLNQSSLNGTVTSGAATVAARQVSPASSNKTPTPGPGPVVGVASISKQTTIREFNNKNHYNDWQFVYDPTTDNLATINGPNQPLPKGTGSLNLSGSPLSSRGMGVKPGQMNPPATPEVQ